MLLVYFSKPHQYVLECFLDPPLLFLMEARICFDNQSDLSFVNWEINLHILHFQLLNQHPKYVQQYQSARFYVLPFKALKASGLVISLKRILQEFYLLSPERLFCIGTPSHSILLRYLKTP
jgi:hypothetical protein